jgi:hypothetical protein
MGDLSKHPAVVLIPLVISVVALGLGVASLIQSCGIETEQRAVELEVEARAASHLGPPLTLTVSFANESLRSIIVRRAGLWRGDHPLVREMNYSNPEPRAERSQFPLTLEAREGRNLWLSLKGPDAEHLAACSDRRPDPFFTAAERRKCELWRGAVTPGPSPPRPLELRLHLVPGGVYSSLVRVQLPQTPDESGWLLRARELLSGRRGITLYHDGTGPTAGIVRLDLWRTGDHEFHRSFERPLIRRPIPNAFGRFSFGSSFPLSQLERGRYEYAFGVGGRAVRTGCFSIPFRKRGVFICG